MYFVITLYTYVTIANKGEKRTKNDKEKVKQATNNDRTTTTDNGKSSEQMVEKRRTYVARTLTAYIP